MERIFGGGRGRQEQWKSPHPVPPKLCDVYFEPQSTTQVKTQSSGNSQCRPISPPKDLPATEPLQGNCLPLAALLERFLQTSPPEDNSLLDHHKSQVHHLSQLSTLPYWANLSSRSLAWVRSFPKDNITCCVLHRHWTLISQVLASPLSVRRYCSSIFSLSHWPQDHSACCSQIYLDPVAWSKTWSRLSHLFLWNEVCLPGAF